jgi:hypothetical protein
MHHQLLVQPAMAFEYKAVLRVVVQVILVAVFLNFFGLVSYARYQNENVFVTTSKRPVETQPAPAITLCPMDKHMSGYPDMDQAKASAILSAQAARRGLIDVVCKDVKDGEVAQCIEEKTFNLTSAVKYFTKDGLQGKQVSGAQHWIPYFTSTSMGMCFTLNSSFPMRSKIPGALRFELDGGNEYVRYIHDPDFFFIADSWEMPFNPKPIMSGKGANITLYAMRVIGHRKLNRVSEPCNPNPSPTFTACIKESFSKEVDCRQRRRRIRRRRRRVRRPNK